MVGGKVVEVIHVEGKTWVNCQEVTERGSGQLCAIYVYRSPVTEKIKPGDHLWWQGHDAMWTPEEVRFFDACDGECGACGTCSGLKDGVDYDIRLPRASWSGVARPEGY